MRRSIHVIANADDLGYSPAVNEAVLHCYRQGYLNSSSLMTNTSIFHDTVMLIRENPLMVNIGVHVDLAEGRPLTTVAQHFLRSDGNWNGSRTNRVLQVLSQQEKSIFSREIHAQIQKALDARLAITHLDSHLHLHTLPCFFPLFVQAARHFKLKLRIAQTYNEGNWVKFWYRRYINRIFLRNNLPYSDRFETVERFLAHQHKQESNITVEVMLHPWFDASGALDDQYEPGNLDKWINFLQTQHS